SGPSRLWSLLEPGAGWTALRAEAERAAALQRARVRAAEAVDPISSNDEEGPAPGYRHREETGPEGHARYRLKAGPKTNVAASPLDLGHLDGLSEAERCIQFTEEFCVCPEGYGAGKPMRLRDWQREFLQGVYAPEVKIGALSVAKGNGKTGLLAAV